MEKKLWFLAIFSLLGLISTTYQNCGGPNRKIYKMQPKSMSQGDTSHSANPNNRPANTPASTADDANEKENSNPKSNKNDGETTASIPSTVQANETNKTTSNQPSEQSQYFFSYSIDVNKAIGYTQCAQQTFFGEEGRKEMEVIKERVEKKVNETGMGTIYENGCPTKEADGFCTLNFKKGTIKFYDYREEKAVSEIPDSTLVGYCEKLPVKAMGLEPTLGSLVKSTSYQFTDPAKNTSPTTTITYNEVSESSPLYGSCVKGNSEMSFCGEFYYKEGSSVSSAMVMGINCNELESKWSSSKCDKPSTAVGCEQDTGTYIQKLWYWEKSGQEFDPFAVEQTCRGTFLKAESDSPLK